MWIFGYGSLIWRPDFAFEESRIAVLMGWRRAFTQGSPDHRGTPRAPGRVVTLREESSSLCWGVAYRVRVDRAEEILAALDHREQGGYERTSISLSSGTDREESWQALTYVAPPGNPHDLGCAPVADMVAQMASAVGPSGSNREYVLRLSDALDERNISDPVVTRIASALVERAAP